MTFQLFARVETKSAAWIVGRAGLFLIFQFLMLWRRQFRLLGRGEEPRWVSCVLTIRTSRNLFMLSRMPTSLAPSTSALLSQTNSCMRLEKEQSSSYDLKGMDTGRSMPEFSGKR